MFGLVKLILFRMFGSIALTIQALMLLSALENSSCHQTSSGSGKTREYYIAAVERDWDYAPSGLNKAKGLKLQDDR